VSPLRGSPFLTRSIENYFYASSACVYPTFKQTHKDSAALKESDAYPANPENGYGWEKLFSERMCKHFYDDFGLQTRIVRYHNVYGTYGTFDGGREKAPAAICRKVAEAKIKKLNTIEIWGDGKQTRSFLYIDDCIEGTLKLFYSNYTEPLNIGSDEQVSINQLVDIAEDISSLKLERKYLLDKPKGVRGRSSNNERLKKVLNWNYSVKLKDGIKKTYDWIYKELKSNSSNTKKYTRNADLLI